MAPAYLLSHYNAEKLLFSKPRIEYTIHSLTASVANETLALQSHDFYEKIQKRLI